MSLSEESESDDDEDDEDDEEEDFGWLRFLLLSTTVAGFRLPKVAEPEDDAREDRADDDADTDGLVLAAGAATTARAAPCFCFCG